MLAGKRMASAPWLEVAGAMLVFCLGCAHSWQKVALDADIIESGHPEWIMLTLTDGSEVLLHAPEVRGDTLFGWWDSNASDGGVAREPLAIEISDIATSQIERRSVTRTAARAFAGVVVVGAMIAVIVLVTVGSSMSVGL